jgi:hypothetical protein
MLHFSAVSQCFHCVLKAKASYNTRLLRQPFLQQLPFTRSRRYTNQLLHKLVFAQASFYASRFLPKLTN